MRIYEVVVVFKTTLAEAQRKKLVDTIKELVKNLKITKEEEWGQKAFSYPIKKETSGYFIFLGLEGDAPISADFEKRLIHNEQVLRHLVVRRK